MSCEMGQGEGVHRSPNPLFQFGTTLLWLVQCSSTSPSAWSCSPRPRLFHRALFQRLSSKLLVCKALSQSLLAQGAHPGTMVNQTGMILALTEPRGCLCHQLHLCFSPRINQEHLASVHGDQGHTCQWPGQRVSQPLRSLQPSLRQELCSLRSLGFVP